MGGQPIVEVSRKKGTTGVKRELTGPWRGEGKDATPEGTNID